MSFLSRFQTPLLFIGILLVLVWTILMIHAYTGRKYISENVLQKMIRQNDIGYFVDVRTLPEWNQGHVSNALHVPVQELNEKHPVVRQLQEWSAEQERQYELWNGDERYKKRCIVVYCRTGNRARMAVEQLAKLLPDKTCLYYTTLSYEELNKMNSISNEYTV